MHNKPKRYLVPKWKGNQQRHSKQLHLHKCWMTNKPTLNVKCINNTAKTHLVWFLLLSSMSMLCECSSLDGDVTEIGMFGGTIVGFCVCSTQCCGSLLVVKVSILTVSSTPLFIQNMAAVSVTRFVRYRPQKIEEVRYDARLFKPAQCSCLSARSETCTGHRPVESKARRCKYDSGNLNNR